VCFSRFGLLIGWLISQAASFLTVSRISARKVPQVPLLKGCLGWGWCLYLLSLLSYLAPPLGPLPGSIVRHIGYMATPPTSHDASAAPTRLPFSLSRAFPLGTSLPSLEPPPLKPRIRQHLARSGYVCHNVLLSPIVKPCSCPIRRAPKVATSYRGDFLPDPPPLHHFPIPLLWSLTPKVYKPYHADRPHSPLPPTKNLRLNRSPTPHPTPNCTAPHKYKFTSQPFFFLWRVDIPTYLRNDGGYSYKIYCTPPSPTHPPSTQHGRQRVLPFFSSLPTDSTPPQ